MSYTGVTGMRSNRYPLMGMGSGMGCGCDSPRSVGNADSIELGLPLIALGAITVGLWFGLSNRRIRSNRRGRRSSPRRHA